MFFDVTKYDVITLEESRLGMDFIRLSSKLVALSNALGKENVDDDMILDGLCSLLVESLSNLKEIAHLAYENAKDLFGVDGTVVYRYLKQNNLSPKTFPDTYSECIDSHARHLLLHMIAEEEGIDFSKARDPRVCRDLTNSNANGLFMILDKPVTELNPDNFKLMHKMTKPDFSVTELTQSEIDRLNRYHEEYMKERIYSRVTDKSLDDEDILSHAKKIGAKRNGTF